MGGDQTALASLLEYYRPRLRQMLVMRIDRKLFARIDPSDVIQETFFDAQRQITAYLQKPRVEFYVWLRGLAWQRLLNLCRFHAKTQRRAMGRELSLPAGSSTSLLHHLVTTELSPSGVMATREIQDTVQRALARLKDEDCEVILMRHFEGMTNNEVAQTLNLSASGATMRYGRAMYRLKEILQRELEA
jgi:RNA polymerase sigma-70 factor (ECF subfamily)